jgi:ubiquinone/menaquinone biosynthesis C-methylase UbiE
MNHSIIRNNYNRMSGWYDLFTGSEKRFAEIGLQTLNILPGEKVLEIGFGTGQSLIKLAGSTGVSGRVDGIELSEGMLRVANRKISRAGLSSWVETRLGDALNLPFADAFYDAIFTSFTLELFDPSEIPLVLNECKRVLIADGRLCVVALQKAENRAVRIYEWFHRRMPLVVDCQPIDVQEIIETAAFTPVNIIESSMWGLPVEIILARKHGK